MQQHYYKFWRDLIKPKGFEIDKDSQREDYARFVIRPLEKGFGVTLGNSLRRILLSSMMGSAVSAVKFEGVLHEFTTIPDVLEDVSDIILNIKEVRFKHYSPDPITLKISKKGPGKVTAADIITNDKIEVLNPEQHIATLGANANFEVELLVSFGRGYDAAETRIVDLPIGYIAIDSLYDKNKA